MKKLFNPAINLMNNLRYSRKFIVLGGLSLLALLVVSMSLITHLSESISTANQQLAGLKQTQKTSRLIQSLQQHRGISAAVIAGVYNSANDQVSINKSVNDNLLKVSNSLPSALKKAAKWSTIMDQWQYLSAKEMILERDESFNLHTKLIKNINSLQLKVADYYYLLVMDDLDSYYLTNSYLFTIPITLELLGQSRAVGASYIVNKNTKSRDKIKKLLSNTLVPLKIFQENMDKVNRELMSEGENMSAEALIQTVEQHIKLTLEGMLTDSTALSSLELYNLSTSVIDVGYQFLDDSLSYTLSNLLHNRVKQANTELIVNIGFSSALFMIVLYFIIGT